MDKKITFNILFLKSVIYYKNMEKLDVKNIIEIDRIRKILSSTPDLLNIFDYIIK